ncbi:hypothetical protein [Sulfurimonas sp.]|uniref:hypothetical protein n=1 Tax=Sulfurimonas sp. TaxID=2022749 RepID=UPI0019E1D171|nr:hypothetical protein [Sulfurimonas sp.]MBE0513930.1 hypothetical protein [Sulfurimonas sp.]
MAIQVKKSNLQQDKYSYTWDRDKGDGEYAGKLDGIKVDKDEGYEVLYFIQALMNKHNLTTLKDIYKIEDLLHKPALSGVVMRDKLIEVIEKRL